MQPPPTVEPGEVSPWKAAARKVEEERGEPTGRKAEIEVPAELKHYSDRRRFLAVQIAEWRKQKYDTPHDYAELIQLIKRDQLTEMEPFGEEYILYGVGANATDEPFTHYDRASNEDVALYKSQADFEQEYSRLSDEVKQAQAKTADLEKQVKLTPRRDRTRRNALLAEVAGNRKSVQATTKKRELLASFYKNPQRRELLAAEYRAITELAANFGGKSYDLDNAADRQQLKVRLLSFIRPEARDLMLEIARSYKERFDRPLPITSLVRTERYQLHLSETNPNATRTAVPPHTTGLAFDIYYYYMTAAEQDYLMAEIARLKSGGRVEALRENRNHIHVFAFADGRPPEESLIARSMGLLGPSRAGKSAGPEQARAEGKSKDQKIARSTKKKKSTGASRVAASRSKKGKSAARASG